ncbi:PAS domain-containing protein [Bavariicoccus seileri]|uniref:PAS domain-containing protein n=1 Tax=Bavariicoccus seileri TaxID=549685 RepID=UPI003F8DAF8D
MVEEVKTEKITFDTGSLTTRQLEAIFRTIEPEFDFIDDQDIVRWYSNNRERLFKREVSALGQHVLDVHPKHSAGRIKQLLADMHSGNKDYQTVTVPIRGKIMNMTFHAVRDDAGTYLGCIEVTQDVTRFSNKSWLGHVLQLFKKTKKKK